MSDYCWWNANVTYIKKSFLKPSLTLRLFWYISLLLYPAAALITFTLSHEVEYISIKWSDSPFWSSWTGPEVSHYVPQNFCQETSVALFLLHLQKRFCLLQNVGDIWLCRVTFAVSLEEIRELCEKQWKENLWCMVSVLLLCSWLCYTPLDGGW